MRHREDIQKRPLIKYFSITLTLIIIAFSPVFFRLINKQQSSDLKAIEELKLKTLSGETYEFNEEYTLFVINSWSSWCTFCIKELPDFIKLQENNSDIIVISINRGESIEINQQFFNNSGINQEGIIFLLDPEDNYFKTINGSVMPETVFIDKNGNIVDRVRGPMEYAEMQTRVDNLIKE